MILNELKIESEHKIAFVCQNSSKTIQYAKSMLEWMNDKILSDFESNRETPLELK